MSGFRCCQCRRLFVGRLYWITSKKSKKLKYIGVCFQCAAAVENQTNKDVTA